MHRSTDARLQLGHRVVPHAAGPAAVGPLEDGGRGGAPQEPPPLAALRPDLGVARGCLDEERGDAAQASVRGAGRRARGSKGPGDEGGCSGQRPGRVASDRSDSDSASRPPWGVRFSATKMDGGIVQLATALSSFYVIVLFLSRVIFAQRKIL